MRFQNQSNKIGGVSHRKKKEIRKDKSARVGSTFSKFNLEVENPPYPRHEISYVERSLKCLIDSTK